MKNYSALTTLNAEALLVDLYARDVITTEEKDVIDTTIPLRSKKMQYIIDQVIIPSLKVDTIVKFKRFLEAMEASEDVTIKAVGSRLGMLNFSHREELCIYGVVSITHYLLLACEFKDRIVYSSSCWWLLNLTVLDWISVCFNVFIDVDGCFDEPQKFTVPNNVKVYIWLKPLKFVLVN